MSQAEYHPDSSVAIPPEPPTGSTVPDPPSVPPPPSLAPTRSAATDSPQAGAVSAGANVPPPPAPSASKTKSSAAVPPPPPPRSTVAPVRAVAETAPVTSGAPVSGVGAAKGVRWRGELEKVETENKRAGARPTETQDADESEEHYLEDARISREAPPWLVSMVLHLVMLLIFALISSPAGAGLGKVILTIGQSEKESPSEFTEFAMATEFSIDDADAMKESEVDADVPDLFESFQVNDALDVAPVELGIGEIAIAKPMFNGRSGAMKKALLAIYGGTPETEEAVKRGLAWLKRNQRKDGSWSMRGPYSDGAVTENNVAATSMALLAFLGDGNTHLKGEYADTVEKGMKFLINKQGRNGFFAKGARNHEQMYAQAQASIAICELYGMSKDSWLRPRAELAIEFAEKSQSPEGGWRYNPGVDSDTSVTGWFVMALQSARSSGLTVDEDTFANVNRFLDSAASFEGAAYGYQARSQPTAAMTAEGILCRQYIGWQRNHPPMFSGIQALLKDSPFEMRDRDVYYWYYATQVMHHFGGSPWREWNEVMRVELPRAQVTGGREDGSWAPQQDRWGRNSGRLYTTCLSIYCLEVYYRHMPLYQAEEMK